MSLGLTLVPCLNAFFMTPAVSRRDEGGSLFYIVSEEDIFSLVLILFYLACEELFAMALPFGPCMHVNAWHDIRIYFNILAI